MVAEPRALQVTQDGQLELLERLREGVGLTDGVTEAPVPVFLRLADLALSLESKGPSGNELIR